MENEKYLSTKEAAKFLGVDRKTIQRYRKRGILIPDLLGKNKSVLYKESQLIEVAKFLSSSGDSFLKRNPKTLQNFCQVGTRSENSPEISPQVGTRSENSPEISPQVGTRSENSSENFSQVANCSENSSENFSQAANCSENSSENGGKEKKKLKIVEVDNFVKPTSLSMANTKLSNCLFDKSKDLTEPTALIVSGKNEEEVTIRTQVFLASEKDLGLVLSQELTAYDRAVHDGVCSVIANNNTMTVTNRQIYEAMTGRTTTSSQALGHITRSMNKLNRTRVYVNYTDHAKSKGMDVDKMVFSGNLLDFQEVEIVFNKNQSFVGYKILTTPILYKYALEVGQVITVDSKVLNSLNVANTDESIVLKHYLLRRIEAMKNKYNNVDSNNILFDTMFEYCGVNGNGMELRRKREIVFKILQDWKKIKYIKDFAEYRGAKNKILGIEITLYKLRKKNEGAK